MTDIEKELNRSLTPAERAGVAAGGRRQVRPLPELYDLVTARPLLMVPPAVRPEVLGLWMVRRHLKGLEHGPHAISANVGLWVAEHGLHEDDAREVLRRAAGPRAAAAHRFASDLLADLAKLAVEAIDRRRQREDQADRQAADARAAADAVGDPAAVRAKLREWAGGVAAGPDG